METNKKADTTDGVKKMNAKTFRELGYLQEVNRQFLHPLGLALEVIINDDNDICFGGVWDYRDDPEGIMFHKSILESDVFEKKKTYVGKEMSKRLKFRSKNLGFCIQDADTHKSDD